MPKVAITKSKLDTLAIAIAEKSGDTLPLTLDEMIAAVASIPGGSIPCTAISLDYNSLSFDTVGETKTLTATLTPSNTTDTLVWSSSNTNVATVSGGLVTIHGIGSATITATCGNQSATATISQTSIRPDGTFLLLSDYVPYYNSDRVMITARTPGYALGNVYTDDDTVRMQDGQAQNIEMIKAPYGATTVKVATQNNTSITFYYLYIADCTDLVTHSGISYPRYLERKSSVSSSTGAAVTAGKCVSFALYDTPSDTPIYVYFE